MDLRILIACAMIALLVLMGAAAAWWAAHNREDRVIQRRMAAYDDRAVRAYSQGGSKRGGRKLNDAD
jgi:hypothetical protein